MEGSDQSLGVRSMMCIVEESVFVSVYVPVKVMDAVAATGRCGYQ